MPDGTSTIRRAPRQLPNGRWEIHVDAEVHAELERRAAAEGISIDEVIMNAVTAAKAAPAEGAAE